MSLPFEESYILSLLKWRTLRFVAFSCSQCASSFGWVHTYSISSVMTWRWDFILALEMTLHSKIVYIFFRVYAFNSIKGPIMSLYLTISLKHQFQAKLWLVSWTYSLLLPFLCPFTSALSHLDHLSLIYSLNHAISFPFPSVKFYSD